MIIACMLGAFTDCVRDHHRISASTKEAQAQAYFSACVEILREHNQRGTLVGSPYSQVPRLR